MSESAMPLPPQEPIPSRLNGLVAVITGGAGNIGLESARRYLLEGAKVTLVDLNLERLEEARKTLLDATGAKNPELNLEDSILITKADVTAEEDVQRYVQETVGKFGRLDVALLCAGISYNSTSILDTDVELYDRVMHVNCRSCKCWSRLRPNIYRSILTTLH